MIFIIREGGVVVRIVIVDRNDWFRRMMEEELGAYGVEVAGGSRTPEGVREIILNASPQVLLWTEVLEDMRGQEVARLLAGLPAERLPAVVKLGEFQQPPSAESLGNCVGLGKREGISALARAVGEAAARRERLLAVLEGNVTGDAALDALLDLLCFAPDRAGTRYLRRGLELWVQAGEQPEGLYDRIGETFSVNGPGVERGIRVITAETWAKAPAYARMLIFGGDWERVPTNLALLGTLAGVLPDAGRA